MSALFAMQYRGQSDAGIGAVYIGKNTIVGADAGGGRYNGTYTEEGNRLQAEIILSMPNGGILVTGTQVPPGTKIPMTADWPLNFADGQAQQVMVDGNPVNVTFEKIGDIP